MAHLQDFDPDTGELPLPNGTAARAAPQPRPVIMAEAHRWLQTALEKAVADLPIWIQATTKSGKGEAKYAKLHVILAEVRAKLLNHGLRIRQGTDRTYAMDEGGGSKGRLVVVYTDIVHASSGEFERTQVEIPLPRLDPQGMGSAITYGRRYSLLMALGLATDEADDDGERGVKKELAAKVSQSDDELALITEIKATKKLDDLIKWSSKPENTKRLNALEDAAVERVQLAYTEKREFLSEADAK